MLLDSNDNRSRPLKIKIIKLVIKSLSSCLILSSFFLIFALYILLSICTVWCFNVGFIKGPALYHHTCLLLQHAVSYRVCVCVCVCVCMVCIFALD